MKPNDKVVCVDDNFHDAITSPFFRFVGPIPKKDSIYTVEKILSDDEGVKSLRLTGATVFYSAQRGEFETGFRAIRFRKLDEVKQSRDATDEEVRGASAELVEAYGTVFKKLAKT